MGFLTGGSKSSSSSGNLAYGDLKGTFSPVASQGATANNYIANLLGLGGDAAAQGAFQNFLGNTGYNFQLQQGQRAITSSAAAQGSLNSGATLKALTKYGQNLGSNYFQQYLQNLSGVANTGLQAGQLIAGAGQTSQSKEKSSEGFGSIIGGALGVMFSDERLKKNMKHWATDANGLRYYTWEWNERAKQELGLPEGKVVGVSAQELRGTKFEHALQKSSEGYDMVAYKLLPEPTREAA